VSGRHAGDGQQLLINLVLNNPFLTDSRSWKIARSAADAGHAVTVLARGGDGLPDREAGEGFTILRLTPPVRLPWLPAPTLTSGDPGGGIGGGHRGLAGRARTAVRETVGRVAQVARYLLATRSWAGAWSGIAPAADIWQSEGLVTLPVTIELARRHGGRVVYDSRDVHVESGRFARLPGPWRTLLRARERSWVRSCDALVTVSQPYADVLERSLGRRPDAIVMNCPPLWVPPDPPPRVLHEELGLAPDIRIVLYLGQVAPGRGVEQLVEAIGRVDRAVLVVGGWGSRYEALRAAAAAGPTADRVRFIPGVAPDRIPIVVASADVSAMPVHGTTLNHRLNTPTKLFDAIGAGTPVVASDLPAMAEIVRETGCGELCDPTDPDDIGRAIRAIVDASLDRRSELRAACLRAAGERYNWERQADVLLDLYRLLGAPRRG
jgi:glycosyltransferase involved in cell wall biosynthesis